MQFSRLSVCLPSIYIPKTWLFSGKKLIGGREDNNLSFFKQNALVAVVLVTTLGTLRREGGKEG